MANDASRVLAVVCMVLASKTKGEIDGSEAGLGYLKRAGYLNSKPNLEPLVECGFLEVVEKSSQDASAVLADASSSSLLSSSLLSLNKGTPKSFRKPTPEELAAYCTERGRRVDPEKWLAYYESNGWRVGKNPMRDWKAAVRTWEKSEFNRPPQESKREPLTL